MSICTRPTQLGFHICTHVTPLHLAHYSESESTPRALSLCAYINFIVFGLTRQGRNYGLLSSEASGPQQVKFWLYLKLQGYFGYENDRTHVIKVVVLVVKITIQLAYGIHVFKKKEVM